MVVVVEGGGEGREGGGSGRGGYNCNNGLFCLLFSYAHIVLIVM